LEIVVFSHAILNQFITSAVRAFCPSYFPHFASGLEPRHIGTRPKGTPFGLGRYPKP